MKTSQRIVLWVLGILLFSLLGSAVSNLAHVFLLALVVALRVYPGEKFPPRLVRLLPWLWGFGFLGSVLVGFCRITDKEGSLPFEMQKEMMKISNFEVAASFVFPMVLFYIYKKKFNLLKSALAVSFLFSLGFSVAHLVSENFALTELLQEIPESIAEALIVWTVYRLNYRLKDSANDLAK